MLDRTLDSGTIGHVNLESVEYVFSLIVTPIPIGERRVADGIQGNCGVHGSLEVVVEEAVHVVLHITDLKDEKQRIEQRIGFERGPTTARPLG